MARLGRPGMSDAQKRQLWDRWKAGESISQIARALDKPPGSVFTVLKSNGGYVPPIRMRRPGSLTVADRERSPAAWPVMTRCGRSPGCWAGPHRR